MADETLDENAKAADEQVGETAADGESGDAAEGGEGSRIRKNLRLNPKKIAILSAPLVVLLAVGGYFAIDQLPSFSSESEMRKNAKVYYNLPEMVVNLSSKDKRAQYLKLKVSLEAKDQKVLDALNPIMPRVLDMFQLYLRELRSSDLEGSAGIYRLKEELLRRINLEIHPYQVSRVLFNEIIVQ